MPFSFANPALLFGALTAALPVIIHLISRRKVRRQQFSDLRFLDEVNSTQSRSLGIKRWLLLLLRVLALLCLALAVAQPRWGGLAASGRGARSILFVIDSSASMKSHFEGGTRFGSAIAAVEGMIRSLPEGTSVQILTAGAAVIPVFSDWLPAEVAAAGRLINLNCSDGAFDLAAVLRESARQVGRAPGSPVELVLLSDLQDTGGIPGLAEAVERLKGIGSVLMLVRQVGDRVTGGGILDVTLPGRTVLPGENITLKALVTTEFAEQVFWLDLDGRTVAESVMETVAGGTDFGPRLLEFPLTVPATGIHLGRIRKESDACPADDTRPFVLKVPASIEVLLVHGPDRAVEGHPGRGGWRFLAQALDPGGLEGAFRVKTVTSNDMTTGTLGSCDLAVFVNPDPLSRQALGGLSRWLKAGGTALFVVGEPTQAANLESTILPLLDLPGSINWNRAETQPAPATGATVNQSSGISSGHSSGQRLHVVDPSHPIFSGLEAETMQTFAEVLVHRWFRFDEGTHRVLLTLTGDDPLLIEGNVGEGCFALMTCDLLPATTDLAANPMALPFFQRLAAWLGNRARLSDAINTNVGTEAVVRPSGPDSDLSLEKSDELLVLDDGSPMARSASLTWLAGEPILSGGMIHEAGFVTFLSGDDTVGIVAAGTPAEESATGLRSLSEWSRLLDEQGLVVAGDLTSIPPAELMSALEGHDLVGLFLVLTVILLMLESVLGRGVRSRSPEGS
ncbi:MAG: BatA domain-containing protein [Gemmatimonadales bacterium]|nr:BatA domain-containing protein [Gemmatimonadales bacterium]